jgi:hypothetical protein
MPLLQSGATAEDWSFLSKIAIASISSQGTVGGLLVAGFVSAILNVFRQKINYVLFV